MKYFVNCCEEEGIIIYSLKCGEFVTQLSSVGCVRGFLRQSAHPQRTRVCYFAVALYRLAAHHCVTALTC
jgi:hypothetical protein